MSDRDDKNTRSQPARGSRSKGVKARGKTGLKAGAKGSDEAPHWIGGAAREATEPPGKDAVALARQLRRMAAGAAPFQRFTYTSLWIKRIWLAAAEELDPERR